MPSKSVKTAKPVVKSATKSSASAKSTVKKAAPAKAAAPAPKKAAPAKKAAVPAKKAAVPAKAAAAKGSKPTTAVPVAKKAAPAGKAVAPKAPAAAVKAAPAKKAVAPKAPAVAVKAASAKKAAPAKAAPAAKKIATPVSDKVSAKAKPAEKGVSPKAPGAASRAAKPVAQEAPAKAAPSVVKGPPVKTKKTIKEEKAKAAVKAKILAQVAARQAVAVPSPAPNAFILREEKKVNTVVAHRRMSPKVGEAPLNGIRPGEYKPEFVKSILDRDEDNVGPVFRYSDDDLSEFRILINSRLDVARKELAYLQGLLTHKDEAGTEDTENRYMNMEDGSGSMDRENMANMASRQIQFIDHLEKALIRIENKTYGICRVTGKLIDKARLRAVPHATLSMEAKSGMNRN